MKISLFSAILAATLVLPLCAMDDRIEVRIPTVSEEINYIWRTLQDIPFFEEHGYDVNLPDDPLIESMIDKSKRHALSESDRIALDGLMRGEIYNERSYENAFEKIETKLPLINNLINRLENFDKNWSFRRFDAYQVNLTLYGPGGSFDPENGSILIFVTPEGSFKQYEDPACTIIHEIVHIGIEDSIVSRFSLPHPLKERIVDIFVHLAFQEELPEYRIQEMGYEEFDDHFNVVTDIMNLAGIVESFLNNKNE